MVNTGWEVQFRRVLAEQGRGGVARVQEGALRGRSCLSQVWMSWNSSLPLTC